MNWTQRVIEARERGRFNPNDFVDAMNCHACLIGEAQEVLDRRGNHEHIRVDGLITDLVRGWGRTQAMSISGRFPSIVWRNDFDEAEQLCHAVEDAVLELKRSHGA